MNTVFRGKAWCFAGLIDVDWEICPVEYNRAFKDETATYEERLEELGQYCLTKVDPDFPKKVCPGDIVVGGEGFGYGHDHDHACMSLRGVGIAAVLCEISNSNFMRNSIHHGLPVIEIRGISKATSRGDELEVDLARGSVKNLTNGETFSFVPYPDFILKIIEAGGLYQKLAAQLQSGMYS